jgi:hypothetical protein
MKPSEIREFYFLVFKKDGRFDKKIPKGCLGILGAAIGQLRTLVARCPAREKQDFYVGSTDFLPQSPVM